MVRPIDTSLEQRLPLSTDVALQRRFMVVKEPLPGNVRYGLLLEVVDKLAEEVALRHARRTDPPGVRGDGRDREGGAAHAGRREPRYRAQGAAQLVGHALHGSLPPARAACQRSHACGG